MTGKLKDNKLYKLLKYKGKEKQLDNFDIFIAEEILKLNK